MSQENPLRVLSFNIHKGFFSKRKFTLRDMRDQFQKTKADLVFLQEVVGENEKHSKNIEDWPDTSQFEFLAHEVWPHHVYGKNAVYTEGHHGNAILSRYPIQFWENINISTNRFEQRGILHAVIAIPGHIDELHLICLHLNLLESGRRKQIKSLVSRIESHVPERAPLIIAGDFNDWRERITQELEGHLDVKEIFCLLNGCHAKSFPSIKPMVCLDRIYTRGLECQTAQTLNTKGWSRLSDHLPLLAEFHY